MTFLVTHQHTPEMCKTVRGFAAGFLEKKPASVKSMFWRPGEHVGYLFVDAPSYLEAERIVAPWYDYGTAQVVPVLTEEEVLKLGTEQPGVVPRRRGRPRKIAA